MEYSTILELIMRKDSKGLEALYVCYGEKFFGYAVSKWKLDEDQAWEVIYKTLEILVLKLSEYSFVSRAHFENFLFKVFINNLKQHYRDRLKDQKHITYIDMTSSTLDGIANTDQDEFKDTQLTIDIYKGQILDNSKTAALDEALKKLEDTDRDLLLLRAQNYSYEEISQMLNLQGDHLKVRHFRAKQKLIKLLQIQSNENI